KNNYGANIGKVLLKHGGDSVAVRAKAMSASASDARMNGCEMPVIINSGSGNQGITCSLPVIEYAKEYNIDKDKLIRALVLSNLVAIHEKTRIGTLSAFCGAVSAGASAGAGIAYLLDGSYDAIIHTVVNALAISSGIICDGAKASCAAKISTSVDAGIFGYQMYLEHQEFKGGDGIVVKGIENTIRNIGRLSSEGMRETNKEIISMMIEK
ncbi:MAG: L-serine ammonia-lyase, iron-sulfur-dependent, subunit alpha, partial [Solobacterium sp.]|nr:L-serine ammonia-lyase, iron-sulfur-dependent, subunit alpha [Solobacterium sp.]